MRDRGYVKLARARFSEVVNDIMKASQNAVRYDPRSYRDMGLDVAPMKNVTRILADKLDKRAFVVMDAEWTRRMVDAEVKAAAARRDKTFLQLQEVERRMQDAARDVKAANKANARLPRSLRLSPGQVMARSAAQAVMGKILTVRRDRLATQFMNEATMSALRQVADATAPNHGRQKAGRAHDPSTAPEPEHLAALHAAALEEITAQQSSARRQQARSTAREADLTKEWAEQGRPNRHGAGPTRRAPPDPHYTAARARNPAAAPPDATIRPEPAKPTGARTSGNAGRGAFNQPDAPKGRPHPTNPIHRFAHSLPGTAKLHATKSPPWMRPATRAPSRDQDEDATRPAAGPAFPKLPGLSVGIRAMHDHLAALRRKFEGDGPGFAAAFLAHHRETLAQHADNRVKVDAFVAAAEATLRSPISIATTKGSADAPVRTQSEITDAGHARTAQLATQTTPTSGRVEPQRSPSPGQLADPAAPSGLPRGTQIMHAAKIWVQPPASLDRDPRTADEPRSSTSERFYTTTEKKADYQARPHPASVQYAKLPQAIQDAAEAPGGMSGQAGASLLVPRPAPPGTRASVSKPGRRTQDIVQAPDQLQPGTKAEPPAGTLQSNPTTSASEPQTLEEVAASEERKKRRRAILAARRRARGLGL